MFVILSLIHQTGFAQSAFIPEQCPELTSLKAIPLTDVYYSSNDKNYQPYHIDYYDTSSKWLFAVWVDDIRTEEEALSLGNQYLSSLYGNPVPVGDGKGGYTCLYLTEGGVAFATTPPALSDSRFIH